MLFSRALVASSGFVSSFLPAASAYVCGANGFLDCKAAGINTGIIIDSGSFNLTNCVFRHCRTIQVRNGRLNIQNVTFVNSLALDVGTVKVGAVFARQSIVFADNVQFLSSRMAKEAGGIVAESSTVELRNVIAFNNSNLDGIGGAFYFVESNATIFNLTCVKNYGEVSGGCGQFEGGSFVFENCSTFKLPNSRVKRMLLEVLSSKQD